MTIDRRSFVAGTAAIGALPSRATASTLTDHHMYGLISKIAAQPGQRDMLAQLLIRASARPPLPGCLSYIVAIDSSDPDLIWVTEAWQSKEAHAASLSLPSVKAAMSAGGALIAQFVRVAETMPVGGTGLAAF